PPRLLIWLLLVVACLMTPSTASEIDKKKVEVSVVDDCTALGAENCVAPELKKVGKFNQLTCKADAILVHSVEVLQPAAVADPPSLPDKATVKASCVPSQ
ncbi:hypothetical protein PFISCL1PPCAC_16912, partial [Pristionchus fissidentatus]